MKTILRIIKTAAEVAAVTIPGKPGKVAAAVGKAAEKFDRRMEERKKK